MIFQMKQERKIWKIRLCTFKPKQLFNILNIFKINSQIWKQVGKVELKFQGPKFGGNLRTCSRKLAFEYVN